MPLPKYLALRQGTYYVRRPLPLDVQPAYGGRREIWRSLRTTVRRDAEARSHGVLAAIEREIAAKRRELRAADEEKAFLASDRLDTALRTHARLANAMMTGGMPYAPPAGTADNADIAQQIEWGNLQPRPASRTDAVEAIEWDLAELERERELASLVSSVGEDGEPEFGRVPVRHVPALMERLYELIDADRRTLEAQRAIIAGIAEQAPAGSDAEPAKGDTLAGLMASWQAHRKPAPRSHIEARTAVTRFERVNGPLPYAAITDEHARRFKADLLADTGLKNATRQKLWGMLRALLNTAVDDGLLDANPFSRVKLRLEDDSSAREVLSRSDLTALFKSIRDEEEWWLFRIGLYTGARLGEICPLTKADLSTVDGVPFLHIREDAASGRRVKNRGSVRKVPLHRQLIADGLLDWIAGREGTALFTMASPVASKRLNRRMRSAGLGPDKPFHALRHTFKSAARRVMGAEWHDRLTGHAHRTVGETYGDYDLRTLKEKVDLISFGFETPASVPVKQPPAPT